MCGLLRKAVGPLPGPLFAKLMLWSSDRREDREGPVVGRLAREHHIVHRQELLALKLLDAVLPEKGPAPPIDVQLDVFEKVGKWVHIKNKLGDLEETDIDRFKRRINGTEIETPKSRRAERIDRAAQERLDAIKSRLPHGGSSGTDSDSGDSGVEVPSVAGS